MPIYEFRCQECGHRLERLQKISDPDPEICPSCNSSGLTRVISPVGFRLKGKGWYETDFKTQNRRNLAETTPPSHADSTEKSTGTPDTKTTNETKGPSQNRQSVKAETATKSSKPIKSDPPTSKSK